MYSLWNVFIIQIKFFKVSLILLQSLSKIFVEKEILLKKLRKLCTHFTIFFIIRVKFFKKCSLFTIEILHVCWKQDYTFTRSQEPWRKSCKLRVVMKIFPSFRSNFKKKCSSFLQKHYQNSTWEKTLKIYSITLKQIM